MPTLQWLDRAAAVKAAAAVPFRLLELIPDLWAGDPGSGNLVIQGLKFVINIADRKST